MGLEKIKDNRIVKHIKERRSYHLFLFSVFSAALSGGVGMLLNAPIIGAILAVVALYTALVMWIPWNKIPWSKFHLDKLVFFRNYLISAIITFIIVFPLWNSLVSIFDRDNPYKKPLRTGAAYIEVIIDSNDVNIGVNNSLNSWSEKGEILLGKCKEGKRILGMYILTVPPIQIKRIDNNQLRYCGIMGLPPTDESIGKPIYCLAMADCVVVRIDKMPQNSKVVGGAITFTFNSSMSIKIPTPPQTMQGDALGVADIQGYLRKGN